MNQIFSKVVGVACMCVAGAALGQGARTPAPTLTPTQAPALASRSSPALAPTAKAVPASSDALVRVLVLPLAETTLSSPVAGRIKNVNTILGGKFEMNSVLIELDCREAQARREIAKAELGAATEEHEAKLRMQGLQQASDVEVALAASAVARTRSQLSLQEVQASHCLIKAPWRGTAAKLHVRNFMSINPGQPLLDLVRDGVPRLKLNVPSKWVTEMQRGTRFEVRIEETGKRYPAQVELINTRVDAVSQTVEIEGSLLQAHPDLLPGMSGLADFKSTLRQP